MGNALILPSAGGKRMPTKARGVDVKFASKFDFIAEALVAHPGLCLPPPFPSPSPPLPFPFGQVHWVYAYEFIMHTGYSHSYHSIKLIHRGAP